MHRPNVLEKINVLTKFEFVNLGLMLLLLHLALHTSSNNSSLVSSLLIAHIGFFLLWQPSLNGAEKVHLKTLLPIAALNTLLFLLLGDWFIALWLILLTGLTSGSALVNGLQRSLYALATVILFLQLSLNLTPRLFHLQVLDDDLELIIFYSLFIACCLIIFWPGKKNRSVKIDYMHSLLISIGLFSFYITSILISFTSRIHYLESLLLTALSVALFFILLSIVWLPRHGIAGLGQIWEQHILNIGNPFESWVKQTTLLGQNKKITPDLFLKNSIKQLLTLSWVCGIRWSDKHQSVFYGEISHHQTVFDDSGIKFILYSRIPMGSALKIHSQLLLHLMSYFYTSKLREITLKNQTHLKAVYETGSKLTHDIKNILQSLQTLTGIVTSEDTSIDSQALIEKQLPLLTQRLQNTLDKLQTKTDTGRSFNTMNIWWTELQSRYHGRDIFFQGETSDTISIDTDVFDTVLENLLDNARSKRRTNPQTEICSTISIENNSPVVMVCDNGEPVPAEKLYNLFMQILPSADGYGIGLYQSAQLANRNGYILELVNNDMGKVCFKLSAQS